MMTFDEFKTKMKDNQWLSDDELPRAYVSQCRTDAVSDFAKTPSFDNAVAIARLCDDVDQLEDYTIFGKAGIGREFEKIVMAAGYITKRFDHNHADTALFLTDVQLGRWV